MYEIDLQETQDKVEKYKQENKEIISVNISKQVKFIVIEKAKINSGSFINVNDTYS